MSISNLILSAHNENDFFELNKVIEEKVKSLMVDIDSVISSQEDVIQKPIKSASYVLLGKENHLENDGKSNTRNNNKSSECLAKNENSQDRESDELDEKINTTNKTIIRFLKAEVVKLQTDIKTIQCELRKKNEYCRELEMKIKKLEEQRDIHQSQLCSQKDVITKAQISNAELQSKIHMQNAEIMSLKKDIETVRKDVKSFTQLSSNCEIRLSRSLEENEKLRSSLKICQAEGKELREQVRKIQEEKRVALKTAEKQRSDIFQAFKKQTQLVDNLKKQKVYLEANTQIRYMEDDFLKLLNWKPDAS